MKKKLLCAFSLAVSLLFFSCGTTEKVQKPYEWDNYTMATYNYVKVPNDETLQSLFATYQRIMDGQNGETVYRNTVPPGVCADYGYMLILAGKTDEGKALLLKEKELYPESAVFIERVLEMVER